MDPEIDKVGRLNNNIRVGYVEGISCGRGRIELDWRILSFLHEG